VAGQWFAGKAVVSRSGHGLALYVLLAISSLLLSQFWSLRSSHAVTPAEVPIHLYQHVAGELDGRSCPSYPVCSSYARQAIEKHGFLLGSWIMLDRLIHESGDVNDGYVVSINGEQRLYDPLERNDFWLEKGDSDAK